MLEKLASIMPSWLLIRIWKALPASGLKRFLSSRANARFNAGVIGLIYAKDGGLLIVKHTYKRVPWGLPSGALKREQPMEGLTREVFEETGFTIEPTEVLDVLYTPNPSELAVVIEARLVGGLFKPCDEVSEFGFIYPPEGLERLPAPQIALIKKYYKNKGE